jgi:hypothetical protein
MVDGGAAVPGVPVPGGLLHDHKSPLADPGYSVLHDVPAVHAITACVQDRLMALGFLASRVPLEELHRHLPADQMALNEHYTNAVSREFYADDAALIAAYHNLVAHLAAEVFSCDMLFQARPIVRFHFPVPFPAAMRTRTGMPRQFHSDCLGGHPTQIIQGWAALTTCADSAALHCSTRRDGIDLLARYRASLHETDPPFADSLQHFYAAWDRLPGFGEAVTAACRPIPMGVGDLLLFDPRCLHGGTENRTATTRVSVDFRLLPVRDEEAVLIAAHTPTARRFRRGEILDERTASSLRSVRHTAPDQWEARPEAKQSTPEGA